MDWRRRAVSMRPVKSKNSNFVFCSRVTQQVHMHCCFPANNAFIYTSSQPKYYVLRKITTTNTNHMLNPNVKEFVSKKHTNGLIHEKESVSKEFSENKGIILQFTTMLVTVNLNFS